MEDRAQRTKARNLQPLLRCMRGHLERGRTDPIDHPAGVPRGWARPDTLAGLEDADPVESFLWCTDPTPQMPRTARRVRSETAGRVAILRDTSMSMYGMWNQWASLLCTSVMELAQRQKMRVGYVEFNSHAKKYVCEKRRSFFTREYNRLEDRIVRGKCEGLTNYEAPLAMALEEFDAQLPRHRRARTGPGGAAEPRRHTDQHILFITDGRATSGDRNVRKEIALAQELGVAVHTVFIGYTQCPKVLDDMSRTTNGSRFIAYFDTDTNAVQVVERDALHLQKMYAQSGKDEELRNLDRMARLSPVFQRFIRKKVQESEA